MGTTCHSDRRSLSVLVLVGILLVGGGCDGQGVSEKMEGETSAEGTPQASTESTSGAAGSRPEDTAIPGEYIVAFKDEVSSVATMSENLASTHGGRVLNTYEHTIGGFAVENLSALAARALRKNPRVKYVNQNDSIQVAINQSNPPWGLDRIDQQSSQLDDEFKYEGATGEGVTVYVIDSGIRISHNEFGGRASYGYDFVDNDGTAQDCNGHGTHVAGTVGGDTYGVAKSVDIVAVRVAGCAGGSTEMTIANGVEWVTQNASEPAVVNMSVGWSNPSQPIDNAVQSSIISGLPYAIAAGNGDRDACDMSPARVEDAMTVAAINENEARAQYPNNQASNYGSCVDWFAPGKDVLSSHNGSDTDTERLGGTSMAAPHTAGVAALYLEDHSSASPQEVRDAIYDASTKNVVSDAQSANDHLLYVGPPSVTVTGPTTVDEGEQGTWTAGVSRGLAGGPYTYTWDKRGSQDASWTSTCGGGASCTTSFQDAVSGDKIGAVRVFVWDSAGNKVQAKMSFAIKDDDGGGCGGYANRFC